MSLYAMHTRYTYIIQTYRIRVYGTRYQWKTITKGTKGEIWCMDARGVMIISEMIYLNLKYGRHINGNDCRKKTKTH